MISERRVYQKMEELAAIFSVHMNAKRYTQAKHCYETARNVVVFMEFEPEKAGEVFGIIGNRGEIIKDGLFKVGLVDKMGLEVDVKRHNR